MTLVLRLIRQSRWDWPGALDWLAEGDIPADPLADFANTIENCLSVWFLDDEKKELDALLGALAASREKADKLDYVLFAEEHLRFAGIEVRATAGLTPDAQVNACHRDLVHLSASKVLALTTRVWQDNYGTIRVAERKAVQRVADAIRLGRFSLEDLRPRLREAVIACLDDQRGEARKPR